MLNSFKSKKNKLTIHDVDAYKSRLPRSRTQVDSKEQSLLLDENQTMDIVQDSNTSLSLYHSSMEVNNESNKAKHAVSHDCHACQLSGKKMEAKSMVCQCCQTVYCRDCIGMSAKERTVVNNRNDILWLCSLCIHEGKLPWKMKTEQSQIEKFDSLMAEMRQRIDKLETDMQQKIGKDIATEVAEMVVAKSKATNMPPLPAMPVPHNSETDQLASTRYSCQSNVTTDNTSKAQMTYADVAKMKQIVEVFEGKNKTEKSVNERKLNILVFNMKESDKVSKEDKLKEDMNTFRDISNACDFQRHFQCLRCPNP